MSDWAIETAELGKVFGSKAAVRDLNLQVPKGQVFGFLGPNGAGKSTAVKMLLGLTYPSSGAARVLGFRPGNEKALRRIGFLPEHFRFSEWLKARELLDLHGKLYGMPAGTRKNIIPGLLERVGLTDHADRPISDFSKGMLQRIGIAVAIINEPEVVFLDEPTSALDPFGRMLVRGIIRDLAANGSTVFLNSHLLGEVEATCDRAAFVRHGTVLQSLAMNEMDAGNLRVELEIDLASKDLLSALEAMRVRPGECKPDQLQATPATKSSDCGERNYQRIELTVDSEEMIPIIAARIVGSGAKLYSLRTRKRTLEQVFVDIVGAEDSGQ